MCILCNGVHYKQVDPTTFQWQGHPAITLLITDSGGPHVPHALCIRFPFPQSWPLSLRAWSAPVAASGRRPKARLQPPGRQPPCPGPLALPAARRCEPPAAPPAVFSAPWPPPAAMTSKLFQTSEFRTSSSNCSTAGRRATVVQIQQNQCHQLQVIRLALCTLIGPRCQQIV
jgi:hypothetical protein